MPKIDGPPTSQRSDDNLRALVRRNLRDGTLPQAFERTYAGRGSDTPCTGCGVATKVTGVEFEGITAEGRAVTMCRPCYYLWSQETRP